MRKPLGNLLGYLADIGYKEMYVEADTDATPVPVAPGGTPQPDAGTRVAKSRQGLENAPREVRPAADRLVELEALKAKALVCESCLLAEGRQTVVFGTGNPDADLMIIGEGPGAVEDREGVPFVGPSGQLLDKIILAIDLKRSDVYIANVVKCRPPGDRDPATEEVSACRSFLEGQIRAVSPRVILAVGRVAAQTLLGTDLPLGRMRGQWFDVLGVPVRVTYHPAALLRNSSWKRPTWEDVQLVRDRLRRT